MRRFLLFGGQHEARHHKEGVADPLCLLSPLFQFGAFVPFSRTQIVPVHSKSMLQPQQPIMVMRCFGPSFFDLLVCSGKFANLGHCPLHCALKTFPSSFHVLPHVLHVFSLVFCRVFPLVQWLFSVALVGGAVRHWRVWRPSASTSFLGEGRKRNRATGGVTNPGTQTCPSCVY